MSCGHPRPRGGARRQGRHGRDRAQGAGAGRPDAPSRRVEQAPRRRGAREGAGEVVSRSVVYRALLFAALAGGRGRLPAADLRAAGAGVVAVAAADPPRARPPGRHAPPVPGRHRPGDREHASTPDRQDVERELRDGAGRRRHRRARRAGRSACGSPTATSATEVDDARAGAASRRSLESSSRTPSAGDLALRARRRARCSASARACVEQALQIIRNRIDQFGVAEPTIQAQGTDEIVVQLPGIQDPQRAKELIGRTALLEFKLLGAGAAGGHAGEARAGHPGALRQGRRRAPAAVPRRAAHAHDRRRAHRRAASARAAATEGMAVDFVLDARGAKQFGEVTTRQRGRNLAIVLDGVV